MKYDVISDPLSNINDFWSKHSITERFITIFTVLLWASLSIITLFGSYNINVLQEVGSVATVVILAHILGVNGLTKIGDIVLKLKYGNTYSKKQEGNDGLES